MIKKNQTVVPRQFLDLGPVSADEISNSSSEERTRDGSRSPLHNVEVASSAAAAHNSKVDQDSSGARDGGKRSVRNESPDDSETQGWAPSKAPKLEPVTRASVDQSAEATMRKARVSVRARSEAPMVIKSPPSLDLAQKILLDSAF